MKPINAMREFHVLMSCVKVASSLLISWTECIRDDCSAL